MCSFFWFLRNAFLVTATKAAGAMGRWKNWYKWGRVWINIARDLGLKEWKPCVLPQREKLWFCLGSWWLSRGVVTFPSHMEALNVRKTCSPWLWDGQKRKAMPAHVLNVHLLHCHQHLYTTHLPSEITSCRLRVWLGKLCFAFKPLILILFCRNTLLSRRITTKHH